VAAASDPPRRLDQLGKAVVWLLGLVIVANLAALWADLEQLGLVTDVRDGQRVSLQELERSDDRVATAGLLQVGTYLVCGIAFLIWYARAYGNLQRLGARGVDRSRAWAVISWFVPFANLVVPKRVMNVIWRASDPELPAVPIDWEHNRVPAVFHWWWGLWLISTFVANLLMRDALDTAQTVEEAVSIATRFVVIDVVDIIPAVLAIVVVRSTTRRQEQRRRRFVNGQLPVWSPGTATSEQPAEAPATSPG
jgi:Domain of unknown function (DUF4328)